MNVLFSFGAALIPIFGGLFVALRTLLRNAQLQTELTVYNNLNASAEKLFPATGRPEVEKAIYSQNYVNRGLKQLGIERKGNTTEDFNREQRIGKPLTPPAIIDQWVLLVSSMAGIVFLALSGIVD